jgi:hypothetical protein
MTKVLPRLAHTSAVVGLFLFAAISCTAFRSGAAARNNALERDLLSTYVNALQTGDFAAVSFAPDVTFEGPLSNGTIQGEVNVRNFLLPVSGGAKSIRVDRFIVEGKFACIIATLETRGGSIVPFCEIVEFANGRIVRLRPYFDPRQLQQ